MIHHKDDLDWVMVSVHQQLSDEFTTTYGDKLTWSLISEYQPLSEEFILKNLTRLDLEQVARRYPSIYQRYNLQLYQTLAACT